MFSADDDIAPTRVKICGITHPDDMRGVIAAGADAIGLVFHDPSPRCVSIEQARQLARLAGPFVTVVGLFVDAPVVFLQQVLAQVPLQLLQFHGAEPRSYCEQFNRPYIKALRMKPELDVAAAVAEFDSSAGILLDAYRPGTAGGTGETFDWRRVPWQAPCPIVLAGGLNPENVKRAIAATRPYGVDVSSGVESAPGRKDLHRVAQFIDHAKIA